MAERHKTHNGRDIDGRFRVRQADVEDVLEDPDGVEVLRDDVRLGGAIADVGPGAGLHAREIGELIDQFNAMLSDIQTRDQQLLLQQNGAEALKCY